MMNLKIYFVPFIVFFLIDLLWLGFLAKDLYRKHLGDFMADKTNWPAAIIFYLIFIGGLVYFAVNPAIESGNWLEALKLGAIYGFITYVTYDLTNLATLKDWPVMISIIDIAWGTFLNTATATLSFFIIRWLG